MLIPWRSDAPVYHSPWGTGGLIVLNVLVHLCVIHAGEDQVAPLVLHYGSINPLQWITHIFLHAGWMHLIGNMLFLWVFGLIVEGKVGSWKFLSIYGGIALLSGFAEQLLMLGTTGGSVGASGVIFGLMAIALLWAPENEVDCILILGIWFKRFELRVRTLAILYVLFQAIEIVLSGLEPSSGLLHLLGMAAGLPIGIILLRRGWVDCEGWDLFSLRTRRPPALRARRTGSPPSGKEGNPLP